MNHHVTRTSLCGCFICNNTMYPEIMVLDNILINIVYLGDGQMSFATSEVLEEQNLKKWILREKKQMRRYAV